MNCAPAFTPDPVAQYPQAGIAGLRLRFQRWQAKTDHPDKGAALAFDHREHATRSAREIVNGISDNVPADECVKGHGSRDSHLAMSQSLYSAFRSSISLAATGRSTRRRVSSGNASRVGNSHRPSANRSSQVSAALGRRCAAHPGADWRARSHITATDFGPWSSMSYTLSRSITATEWPL